MCTYIKMDFKIAYNKYENDWQKYKHVDTV